MAIDPFTGLFKSSGGGYNVDQIHGLQTVHGLDSRGLMTHIGSGGSKDPLKSQLHASAN